MKIKYLLPISIGLLIGLICIDASAQIQRRKGSNIPIKEESISTSSEGNQSLHKKKKVAGTQGKEKAKPVKQKEESKEGEAYVISFEGSDKIYTDILPNASVGDFLAVLKKSKPFIHPVTKQKILREDETVGYLVIDEVFATYLKCHAVDDTMDSTSVGASVIKSPAMLLDDDISTEEHLNIPTQQNQAIKDLFQEMLSNEQLTLPVTVDKRTRIDPYTIEGKTLYKNIVILKKKDFKNEHKNCSKIYNQKTLEGLAKVPFFLTARRAGFNVIVRFYNPDKSSSFEIEVP